MTRKPITAHADHAAIKAFRDLHTVPKIVPAVPASQSEAWPSDPYEARCPFNYHHATVDELKPFLGTGWAICRATPKNRERYESCITPKQYRDAEAAAIEARGYARPAEKVIQDLIEVIATMQRSRGINPMDPFESRDAPIREKIGNAIQAARTVLVKARVP